MPRFNGIHFSGSGQTQVIYTAPVAKRATVTINLCNLSSTTLLVQLAMVTSSSSTPTNADFIEYNVPLEAYGGTLERSGLTPSDGQKIIAYASAPSMSAVVWGYEE